VLGERLTAAQWLGGTMILGGLIVAELRAATKPQGLASGTG
jgi:drug/metabolite transporter (DMT)-like permease